MALTVIVRSGDVKSAPKVTFDAPRIVVGRGEGCDVRLPDASVSHRHASIRQRGSEYIVVDEGSTNGTFVGPVRLSPHSPRVVRSGDMVRIGRIWLELRVEHVVPTAAANVATKEIALGLVAEALAAQGDPSAVRVLVTAGPDAGRELALAEPGRPYVLGRGQGADLVLDDADASRKHVELMRKGSQVLVRDLGSKNGALLGEARLEAGKDTPWPRGTTLRVGANLLAYEDPVGEALAELERAADERMRDDDLVDAPNASPAPAPTADAADLEPSAPPPTDLGTRGASPIAKVPERRSKPAATERRGWTLTDVVVALIAITVLVVSILGLLWLFRAT
ncbi:MAG: FHA domain-containing protein [Polyangiaceae bacterium]|nr:FHA domain-containing protein [Polyangiaceae bacterium]